MVREISAGGVVIRKLAGAWWMAAVELPSELARGTQRSRRPAGAKPVLTLPKGLIDAGEEAAETALREVREETGYGCHLGRFVGQVEYTDRRGRAKVVSYWLMQPVDGAFEPTPEVDELRWLSLADAIGLLSYSHDRDLLESVRTPLTKASE